MTPGGAFGPAARGVARAARGVRRAGPATAPRTAEPVPDRGRRGLPRPRAGLIGGAVTGSWLAGTPVRRVPQRLHRRQKPVAQRPGRPVVPPTVQGKGAGPATPTGSGPDSSGPGQRLRGRLRPPLRKLFAPLGCERLLRATYTDATQSHVTTVGLLFTEADAAGTAALADRVAKERLDRRTDLVPLPYPRRAPPPPTSVPGSVPPGRSPSSPTPPSSSTPSPAGPTAVPSRPAARPGRHGVRRHQRPAQAGLGHEARGLADRVERGLRKNVGTTTEQPS
ncbi:hypothetical protein ACR6C2_10065 [Streptomyces sp. INA 01156]